ncbi:MAG: rod shape-determining protein MreC [Candidatus Harrisonbacteria bacterium]|nr:rod shape-determining protein MreC [Candidatus Harrisonbacteria bacterium]MBI3114560.1 rod shape-determining protein MreC [Candidatus Harrisonbacteria bacterium]
MRYIFFVIAIMFLLGGIFYGGAFARMPQGLLSNIRAAFALPFLFVKDIALHADVVKALRATALENQSLRAELLEKSLGITRAPHGLLPAKVYALYPFNNKSSVTLALGARAGIVSGATVVAAKGVVFGQVIAVGDDWSEVRTMFDPAHELPVRIGAAGVSGLLRGGAAPTITLIAKGKPVAPGDLVYTASKEYPYGLLIGTLGELRQNPGAAFSDAPLVLPYTLGDIETAHVMIP